MSGSIAVITSEAELPALRESWDGLLERSIENHPFLTYEWLTSWWEAFGGSRRMYLIVVRKDDELHAIAPLSFVTEHRYGRERSVLRLWSNEQSNRANFLVARGSEWALDSIVEHLVGAAPEWDLMELLHLDATSEVTAGLQNALNRHRVPFGGDESLRSPYVDLPDSWDRMESDLGRTFRQAMRAKARKAAARGTLTLEVSTSAEPLDEVMDISQETWQHEAGTSIASAAPLRRFYAAVAHGCARRGWLRLAILRLNGEGVCFEYNLLYNDILYNLKLGFRPTFGHLSPGLVLRYHLMQELIRSGARRYDFMGADEPYKLHWCATVRSHQKVLVFNHRPDLRLTHFLVYRARPFVRERVPGLVRLKRFMMR